MKLGDIGRKVALDQVPSREEIEFFRLQLDRLQNVSSIVAKWVPQSNTDFPFTDYVDGGYKTATGVYGLVHLLHFEGVNGSTEFLDKSGTTWSIGSGTPTISTAQYKIGGSSGLFNVDLITATTTASLLADFTWECWVYPTFSFGTGNSIAEPHGVLISTRDAWNDTNGCSLCIAGGGKVCLTLGYGHPSTYDFSIISTNAVTANAWNHVALVRASGTFYIYINGVKDDQTYTHSANFTNTTIRIGMTTDGDYFAGYIDEVAIFNLARYTASFTPSLDEYIYASEIVRLHRIQFRRGLANQLPSNLLAGEPYYATDTGKLYVGLNQNYVGYGIFQPLDAALTSIALLGTAANKMLYTTGVDTFAEADITAAGRALLDDAAASNQLTTLGIGGLATTVTATKTLTLISTDNFSITFPATGTAAIGAGTLTSATTNDVTGANHTHAITAGFGLIPVGSAQYQVVTAGASPYTAAWSGFLLTGTTGGKMNFAVTNTKTLTLTAAGDYNITFPNSMTFPADGAGVLTNNGTGTLTWAAGGGGGHTIMDEGVAENARTNLDFVGAVVSVSDDAANDKTIVTISAGAGGGDVTGPATNTANFVPQWNGADTKALKDGLELVTTVGSPGSDAKVPSEQAVREILDVANITYTPSVVADWNAGADPGDADDAFNQLAERVKDLEVVAPVYEKWDPDVPPASPHAYDDEFADASLNVKWTPTAGADTAIDFTQTSDAAHYSETIIPGMLLLQACKITQTIDLTDDFTVIVKCSPGFAKGTNESKLTIQLYKDATHYFDLRLGRYDAATDQVRTVYNNGAGALQGVLLVTSNIQYALLSWDDSATNMYSFVSADGIAWEHVETRTLNAIGDWDNFSIEQVATGAPDPVSSIDYVRFSTTLIDTIIGGGTVGVYNYGV